jgi:NitT/TauT family transport system ATP-binding protein
MIELKGITKNFSNLIIYSRFDLLVKKGKLTTIIGPSGFGKTTLLNMVAGIVKPDGGYVMYPRDEELSYLLQENVMLPWRTLLQNIKLVLEVKQSRNKTNDQLIAGYLNRFGLQGFENYYPDALSGGMKQKAAIVRSLITKPDILLLDEPFSNLDFDVKLAIQRELMEYQKKTNATILMVTHDIEDAIALSDEVIVLQGKPAKIKSKIQINLGGLEKDPVRARQSTEFSNYFSRIWNDLKYLNN